MRSPLRSKFQMSRRRRVALVGLNCVPRRGTGDKNSSAGLGPGLTESLDEFTSISIRNDVTQEHEVKVGRGRQHDGLRVCRHIMDRTFWAVSKVEEGQASIAETTVMFLNDSYRGEPARLQALLGWQISPGWTGLSPRIGFTLSAG